MHALAPGPGRKKCASPSSPAARSWSIVPRNWRANWSSTFAWCPAARNGAGPTSPKTPARLHRAREFSDSLPKMPTDDDWQQVKLDQLRAWDWAPENPALLRQQGLEIALTTYGLERHQEFPPESSPRPGSRLVRRRRARRPDHGAREIVRRGKSTRHHRAGQAGRSGRGHGHNYFNPDAKGAGRLD